MLKLDFTLSFDVRHSMFEISSDKKENLEY